MDNNPKQEVAEKLRSCSNVLVTVSNNPTVDQLSAALGLSLMLDKLNKHTTTVFSGQIPNTMEFLEPEKTFDPTVDGLRDFIISLDKDKADKLRYKVEDNVVKIFITPYKSKITQDDLNFSQGDFNVDLVVALGVHKRDELDEAITSHGRILHDASVVTINAAGSGSGNLGAVDWSDDKASSLCEMLVSISEALESGLLDKQMSTAFLTGIVAATDRFKNERTSPKVMTMAAQLMAAGANQQLIASNLQTSLDPKPDISHNDNERRSDQNDKNDKDDGLQNFAAEDQSFDVESESAIPEDKGLNDKPISEIIDFNDSKKPNGKKDKTSQNIDEGINSQSEMPDYEETPQKSLKNDESISEIEDDVRAKHRSLDEFGRTEKLDDEDPAIKQLESELAKDSSTNLIDLESQMKSFRPKEVSRPAEDPLPKLKDVKSFSDTQVDVEQKPMLGGTFNATTDEAHDRIEEAKNKSINQAILSHNSADDKINEVSNKAPDIASVNSASIPDSQDMMKELEAARRAVDQAMGESEMQSGGQPQALSSLNAAPIDTDNGGFGEMSMDNIDTSRFSNPASAGVNWAANNPPQPVPDNPMNQINFTPPPAPMQPPQMPSQAPIQGNPIFNLPPQPPAPADSQPMQPSQVTFPTQPQPQFQPPPDVFDQNGVAPQMPPTQAPPMPPFS